MKYINSLYHNTNPGWYLNYFISCVNRILRIFLVPSFSENFPKKMTIDSMLRGMCVCLKRRRGNQGLYKYLYRPRIELGVRQCKDGGEHESSLVARNTAISHNQRASQGHRVCLSFSWNKK